MTNKLKQDQLSINNLYPPFTTPPTLASWTWLNQGSATAVDTSLGISMFTPAVAGDQIRGLYVDMPSPPFTITAGFIASLINVNYHQAGLILLDSASGKLLSYLRGQSGVTINFHKWNSVSSYNGTYGAVNIGSPGSICYFRITDNNTNRIYYYSADGLSWVQVFTIGRTDFITPDKIGFYVDSNNSTYGVGLHLFSWEES